MRKVMGRWHYVLAVGVIVACAMGARIFAAPNGVPQKVDITITKPAHDGFSTWINEPLPVAASVTPAKAGTSIRWSATHGSYIDPYGAEAVFIAGDFSGALTQDIVLIATAWGDGEVLSSAQVSADGGRAAGSGRKRFIPVSAPAAAPVAGGVPAVDGAAENESYNGMWRFKLGEPPAEHGADFVHEIYGLDHAGDRDSRVAHAKAALALRPNDPRNIILEFHLSIMLGQNEDPAHGQKVKPDEAEVINEHILSTYDHAVYYRSFPIGESDAAEVIMPQVAIWASEYNRVIAKERDKAKKYAQIALDKFDWTFRKRTDDWKNAPKPSTEPSLLDRPEKQASRVTAWEKNKAAAEAGMAVGPYSEELATAMVHVYVLAYAEGVADSAKLLRQLVEKYPKSPISRAAGAQIAGLPPATAPAPARASDLP